MQLKKFTKSRHNRVVETSFSHATHTLELVKKKLRLDLTTVVETNCSHATHTLELVQKLPQDLTTVVETNCSHATHTLELVQKLPLDLTTVVETTWQGVPGCEPLSGEGLDAMGACEALPVPGLVTVGHTALGDHLE